MKKYLIDDIDVSMNTKKRLEEFGLTIFNGREMTKELLYWHGWKELDPSTTLVVLPGNGALMVKKHIFLEKPTWLWQWIYRAYSKASRFWIPGENPLAIVERISPSVFIGIKKVVIIDDVISSGETIRKLKSKNHDFIPGAEWQAVAWVTQQAASLKGFSSIFSVKNVGSESKKVPINSLSTLVACQDIAESYAQRNFSQKADAFLRVIKKVVV